MSIMNGSCLDSAGCGLLSGHGSLSTIDLLLKLAFGEPVTQADALRLLHSQPDRDQSARLERVSRVKARDSALKEAADILGGDGLGAWIVAGRVADAIDRFEVRLWPRLKAGIGCDLSPSDVAIYRAFLTGGRVPKTQRMLYDLLK